MCPGPAFAEQMNAIPAAMGCEGKWRCTSASTPMPFCMSSTMVSGLSSGGRSEGRIWFWVVFRATMTTSHCGIFAVESYTLGEGSMKFPSHESMVSPWSTTYW